MAWPPPKDASDQLLAEEYHLYKTAPGRKAAPSVTKIIRPLQDTNILSQAKAKQTAAIAALEDALRPARIHMHRTALAEKYEGWKPWQHKKNAKVDLKDDEQVYFDWLRMEVDRRWKAKADLGSRVHGHVYDLSMGRDIEALDDELQFIHAWEWYVEENEVEFIPSATERVVVHPNPLGDDTLEFGGRDDLFAIHHAGKHQGLVVNDYKTGGKYPTQVTLQLAGYGNGLGFATYDEEGKVTDQYDPLPDWKLAISTYLHDDGTYEAWRAPVTPATFIAFLDLRRVLKFQDTMTPYEKEAEAEWKAKADQ